MKYSKCDFRFHIINLFSTLQKRSQRLVNSIVLLDLLLSLIAYPRKCYHHVIVTIILY